MILISFFFYCFWVFGKILFNVFMRTEIGFVVFLHVAFMKSYGFFNPTNKKKTEHRMLYEKKSIMENKMEKLELYYMSNL